METISVIDISSWSSGDAMERDRIAKAFGRSCEEWGFLLVAGHGLDPDLAERVRRVTNEFFDLPVEEKAKISAVGRPGGRGYYRVASKSHARTRIETDAPGDLRETFFSGMEAVDGDAYTAAADAQRHFAPNVWPAALPEMRVAWEAYMHACNGIAVELLRIGARALDLPEAYFDDKIDRPISTLTAQYYPKLDRPPEPGQVRSGAHTDFGTLTLLLTEDKPGGLQVQSLTGEWIDVRPIPGAFIVNLGDMMAQWTNDRWRSTLHRVVNPPMDAGEAARRLSIVYFHTPNYDAIIDCIPSCADIATPPKYAPIAAGQHLAEKLRKTDSVTAIKAPVASGDIVL